LESQYGFLQNWIEAMSKGFAGSNWEICICSKPLLFRMGLSFFPKLHFFEIELFSKKDFFQNIAAQYVFFIKKKHVVYEPAMFGLHMFVFASTIFNENYENMHVTIYNNWQNKTQKTTGNVHVVVWKGFRFSLRHIF
jgi:hypothetical protein